MTSSERKIINCLWETKEKTHIRLVAQKANLSSDYARLLCRSLARSGHIKFENDLAHLLKKGRSRFENNDPVADKPTVVAANVTLLTDEPAVASPASDRSDVVQQSSPQEEENQEEGMSDDKDKDEQEDEQVSSDEELDKALADLEPPSKKEEGEKIDEPEEPEKTESAEKAEGKDEQREEEISTESAIEEEKKESPGAATEPKEEAAGKEEAIALEPQAIAESTEAKEEVKADVQETGATETKPADNPASTAPLESSEETAAMKKEENQEKEDAAKPSDNSGWSFKKIVNWFTEKK